MIGQPTPAKTPAQAVHCRKKFLRGQRGVKSLRGRHADIALSARVGVDFAEIAPDASRATDRPVQHRVKLVNLSRLNLCDRIGQLSPTQALQRPRHVRGSIERDAFGRFAIAAGTADFLPIRLDRAGRICVNDKADIRFIDTHAEGDRGDDHRFVLREEPG